MRKSTISREKILESATELLINDGHTDLNMRDVATACDVAVGSIYNYFPTKAALMGQVIEDVWNKVLYPEMCSLDTGLGFVETVSQMYHRAYLSKKNYNNFFILHRSLMNNGDRGHGKDMMDRYFGKIRAALLASLTADRKISASAWASFTPERLVNFVFSNMLTLLSANSDNCEILLVLLKNTLYAS